MHFVTSHIEIIAPELFMVLIFGTLWCIPVTRSLTHRAIRTGKSMSADKSLPKWARYGFLVCTLPIPGPVDEIVGALLTLALLKGRHSDTVRSHWNNSQSN